VDLTTIPEVLFLCVHNAGRSRMPAALLELYAAGRVHDRSAGSTPANEVNPSVIEVMNGVGLHEPHLTASRCSRDLVGARAGR